MKSITVSFFVLALAGCGSEPIQEAQPDPENAFVRPEGPAPQDADLNASLEEVSGLEPRARYFGTWAVGEEFCADAAWRFAERDLTSPAGSVCRFTEVREVPGGYDIAARCTAEAPERNDTIRLRFPEAAGGMLFKSETIADAGLVRCPDTPARSDRSSTKRGAR